MRRWWRSMFPARPAAPPEIDEVRRLRDELARLDDEALKRTARRATALPEVIARYGRRRLARARPADVRRPARGRARAGARTDRRDADGRGQDAGGGARGRLVRALGRRRARAHRQRLPRAARRGMDGRHLRLARPVGRRRPAGDGRRRPASGLRARHHLRDAPTRWASTTCATGSRLYPHEQVLRPFAAAVIDEADSILLDEARIPLVIAGGDASSRPRPPCDADRVVRQLDAAACTSRSIRRRATSR